MLLVTKSEELSMTTTTGDARSIGLGAHGLPIERLADSAATGRGDPYQGGVAGKQR